MTNSDGEGTRRRFVLVPTIAALCALGAIIGAAALTPGGLYGPYTTAVGGCSLIAFSFAVWLETRRSEEELANSRQRVRDAESDFENALVDAAVAESLDAAPYRYGGSLMHSADADPPTPDDEQTGTIPAGELISNPNSGYGSLVTDLALPKLWRVTHARLGEYHGTAVGQAKRAFRNAQYAMGAGFVLLAVFVYAAFHAKSATASATAGVLGAVAAALSGYIAKTFIRSQEMTSQALHRYFEEPLVLSRYLAAERLVRDAGISEQQRADLLHSIVHSMITGEVPGKPAGAPEQTPQGEQSS